MQDFVNRLAKNQKILKIYKKIVDIFTILRYNIPIF